MPNHPRTPPSEPSSDQVAAQQLRAEAHASLEAVGGEWQRLADATGAAPSSGWGGSRLMGRVRPRAARDRRPPPPRRRPDGPAPAAGEVSLDFIDGAAPELDLYRAAAGYRMLERTRQRSPYVHTTGTWDDFTGERPSRNRRSQLGRTRRRLEREGRIEPEVADGRERLEEVLEETFRIEASGWKGANGTAITSRPTPGASTGTSPGGPPPRAGSGSPSSAWRAGHWR